MELEGTVMRILPLVKGTSARGEWSKQEMIIELKSEFNRKVCISFWGDKVQDAASLREGDNVNLSVNIESREYNGRWFTEVRAWKINKNGASASNAYPATAPTNLPPITASSFDSDNTASSSSDEIDDLPF